MIFGDHFLFLFCHLLIAPLLHHLRLSLTHTSLAAVVSPQTTQLQSLLFSLCRMHESMHLAVFVMIKMRIVPATSNPHNFTGDACSIFGRSSLFISSAERKGQKGSCEHTSPASPLRTALPLVAEASAALFRARTPQPTAASRWTARRSSGSWWRARSGSRRWRSHSRRCPRTAADSERPPPI